MRRAVAFVLILGSLSLIAACARKDALEVAYAKWDAALVKAADNEEKVALTRAFLDRFPDSAHTEDAAETLAELLCGELGRPAEADAYLVGLAGRVTTPDTRIAIQRIRLGALGALKDGTRLRQAVAELSQGRDLDYSERSAVADAALECGEWELALSTAEAALPLSTAEAYRADNPGRKLSEQRVADMARRRRVEMLDAKGWALANLSRFDEAVAVLREAHDADFRGYMGNTESLAGSYLGRALAMSGRRDEAERVLAFASLYGGDTAATAALRERFAAGAEGDREFERWTAGQRLVLARAVEDFTLPDYAGTPHTFSKLRNGEVTLLSFWFPT